MSLIRRLDVYILFPAISVSVLSIFLLLSNSPNLFLPQLINIILGLFLYSLFLSIDYKIWPRYVSIFYIFTIISLIVIFFVPQIRGTHRWIDLGFFVLQPSEILKPVVILFYAAVFSNLKKFGMKSLGLQTASFLPILILIFLQPDLGNAIIYSLFFLGLLVIGGVNIIYLISGFIIFILSSPVLWNFLKDYQRQRIYSFINPALDPSGAGYNAIQSMIAVGSGGIFGMGLGRGTQSRLLFLPENQTDFIFASLVESIGLLGGTILLILYLIMLLRILYIAFNSESPLGRIIAIGIFCQILFQIIINIGMNQGILPITGITLPLLSYGGSSVVSTFISLGIINSISQGLPKRLLVIR